MKKLLLTLGLISVLGGLLSSFTSASSCGKEVYFGNTDTCVDIQYVSANRRRLVTTVDGGSTSNLKCDLMTPDSALRSIATCNGEFTYNQSIAGRVKLRIRYSDAAPSNREDKPSSASQWTYPQWIFNFDDRDRFDNNNASSNNYDTDNFYLTTNNSTPELSEYVNLTIKARDGTATDTSYRGTVKFNVYYRASSSSTWTQTTSSTYYTMISSYQNDGYTFTSSNNGIKTLSNLIKFNRNNYSYKVRVYDEDNTSLYKEITFDVGNASSNNYDTDNFYFTTNNSTPELSEYVNLTIKARDGTATDTSYRGTVKFNVYYRASSSSTWTQTTSSTYYTMISSYQNDGYTFTSSNNGIKTLSNLIKFNRNNYSYKVRVYDEDNTSLYKEITFDVGNASSNNYDTDNFYLTTNNSTPELSEYVNLTIKARDGTATDTSYRGTVKFNVYYRASSSSTWTQTTSSTYYTMISSYQNDGYTFTSSNNGIKTLSNLIKFNRNNYSYKVRVYDEDNTSLYKEITFDVGNASSNNYDTDNFYLTTNNSNPNTYERIHLGIRTREGTVTDTSYRGKVKFKVYYKPSGSSVWTLTTSETYMKLNSVYTNGYTFTAAKNGYAYMVNLVKFHKNNYSYKVVVYDENNNIEAYKIFTVGNVY